MSENVHSDDAPVHDGEWRASGTFGALIGLVVLFSAVVCVACASAYHVGKLRGYVEAIHGCDDRVLAEGQSEP